jgi:arylsulfatase A-like enzyme
VNPKAQVYALPENEKLNSHKPAGEPDGDGESKAATPGEKEPYAAGEIAPNRLNTRGPAFECADVPDNTYTDGKVGDLAIAALRNISGKREPFFLAVGFVKPHLPFVAPKKYWDMYDPTTIQLAPNPFKPKDAPDYAILPGDELRMYHNIPNGHLPDNLARHLRHAYYACVSYTDAQVGRVLNELDRLGLSSNTIIILWGDHGWKLGEHDAWAKHSNSENDVNGPLILSVPGMKNSGVHTDALVEYVDVYPTLSELAGLSLPEHLEGTSFKPLLDDPKLKWKNATFSQYPRSGIATHGAELMGYSMRTDRYRFTVWVNRADHSKVDSTELYDHQTDPQENTNIVNIASHSQLAQTLMSQWKLGWQAARPHFESAR